MLAYLCPCGNFGFFDAPVDEVDDSPDNFRCSMCDALPDDTTWQELNDVAEKKARRVLETLNNGES